MGGSERALAVWAILGLLAGAVFAADCPSLRVWPPAGPMPANPAWIVSGLPIGAAFLVSGERRIPLEVQRRFEVQGDLTQVVLRPVSDPPPGLYGLEAEGLDATAEAMRWQVGEARDEEPPSFVRPPTGVPPSGPRRLRFEFQASESPVAVLATIGRDDDPDFQRDILFLLPPFDEPEAGRVELGAGPCVTPYPLVTGAGYHLRIRLVDRPGWFSRGVGHIVPARVTLPVRDSLGSP